jgi:hypothetical protein
VKQVEQTVGNSEVVAGELNSVMDAAVAKSSRYLLTIGSAFSSAVFWPGCI